MEERRRFTRIVCNEKVLVGFGDITVKAKLLNVSINGALVEFENDFTSKPGDILKITLPLNNSNILLQFGSKVVHQRENLVGVKFIHFDLDTMIHLRSFIEARAKNLEGVAEEFAYLV